MNFSQLKVGDQVLISKSTSTRHGGPVVGRWATVTAVRPLSFDADALCFRKDGTEWCGYYRVLLVLQNDRARAMDSLFGAGIASRFE